MAHNTSSGSSSAACTSWCGTVGADGGLLPRRLSKRASPSMDENGDASPRSECGADSTDDQEQCKRLRGSGAADAGPARADSPRSSCGSDCTTAALIPCVATGDEEMVNGSPQAATAIAAPPPQPPPQEAEVHGDDEVPAWLGQEERFTPIGIFTTQASSSKLTPAMRELLVEWMSDVTSHFRLQAETFLLAVNYLDRYLSRKAVARSHLQLLGVTCLWIAAKYEDVHPPSAFQMAEMTENTYSAQAVVRMEAQVTAALDWSLAVPCTSLSFLHAFASRAQVPNSGAVHALSQCLVQLAALDGATFAQAPASRVAACVLSVALAACGHTAGIPHVVRAAQWHNNKQLAHMSKELYARFTRLLEPGARRSCIVAQYLAHQQQQQRALAPSTAPRCHPAAAGPQASRSCSAECAAVTSGGSSLLSVATVLPHQRHAAPVALHTSLLPCRR